jgi:thioredoxin reductase/bacterioferritin-associated ferredoxin
MSAACDVLVIGAGPAGLAAAATAAKLGVAVTLLDEQPATGGQIHRAIEARAVKPGSASQADDARGAALVTEFRASGARYLPGMQAWQMQAFAETGCKVFVSDGEQASIIDAKRVIIAAGAMERAVPIPGWTLPGVMTVGAAQIRLKTISYRPPADTWLAGSGALLWLYTAQVIESGGKLAGILDTTPSGNRLNALRHVGGVLRQSEYLKRGLALQRVVRAAGVPVIQNVDAIEARGEGCVQAVRYRVNDAWHEASTSLLLLHQGVIPHTHATRALGARHHWDALQRCFKPELDRWGNTTVDGYAAAGDCTGIVGAQAALLQGRIAALEAAHALGRISSPQRDDAAKPHVALLDKHLAARPFIDALFAPRASLLNPDDGVMVCRCESITARQIRDALALGAMGPNQVKAFTRCGMGPCQGRLCGLAVSEIVSAARGVDMAQTGLFNARPPLKPLSLAELASLEVQ